MAAVKALSTRAYRMFRTRGYEQFVNALNPLTTGIELALIVTVDDTTGELEISHLSGMTDLLDNIANSANDDIRVSRSAGGVLTAAATP